MEPWLTYPVDGPKTHALVIGVSRYDNVPDPPDLANPELLGIKQAQTPAASAYRFARWLRDDYNPPSGGLANLWLLLSASDLERNDPDVAQAEADVPDPTRDNVQTALKHWKDACLNHPDDVAMLYISGHGVQKSSEGSVVLLQDFHDDNQLNVLERAIDMGGVKAGMSRSNVAQTQFYFVDACRVHPDLFDDYWDVKPGLSIDEPVAGFARVSKVFFGAASGTTALGLPGEGTLFSMALHECLRRKAAKSLEGSKWGVTSESLAAALDLEVSRLAADYEAEQITAPGGSGVDTPIHVFTEPPPVDLRITIEPRLAAPLATADVFDGDVGEFLLKDRPFAPEVVAQIPPGQYSMAVRLDDNDHGFASKEGLGLAAVPPTTVRPVKVD